MRNELRLTTDHPASSYGIPVMVDADGNAYGPRDVVPGTGVMAVWLANGFDAELERKFVAAANLRPEECAPTCTVELSVCHNCGKRHSDLLGCEAGQGHNTMSQATIQLPDGYNGHTVTCFAKPIMEGKSIVWLQVAEPGKQYMRRWCHRETYERALQEVQS